MLLQAEILFTLLLQTEILFALLLHNEMLFTLLLQTEILFTSLLQTEILFTLLLQTESPLYWAVLAVHLRSPSQWKADRLKYLERLLVLGHVRSTVAVGGKRWVVWLLVKVTI